MQFLDKNLYASVHVFYLNYFFDPLIQLSFNYDLLRSAGSSMKKVFSILDEEPVLSTMGSQSPNMESNNVIEFELYNNLLFLIDTKGRLWEFKRKKYKKRRMMQEEN